MRFDTTQDSYIALRNIVAERTNRIVAWVGSGLSAQAGLPTWRGLVAVLMKSLENKAATLEAKDQENTLRQCKEIKTIKDNWLAIERLKRALGETSYRESIREALQPAAKVSIPSAYDFLWKLRISGLLNLNIDRLATRARQSQTATVVIEFTGQAIANFLHVLKSPQPFIVNLHGTYEEYSSWVLTRSELNRLKGSAGYKEFVKACCLNSTILFLGIEVDDEAVGGHLQELRGISKDVGTHYWLTNRRDMATDNWAEDLGVRVIRYDSKDNDHSAVNEFFSDLLSYIPKDEPAPPIEPQKIPDRIEVVDDPKELLKLDSESIREILNKKAKEILKDSSESAYQKYEQFFKDYDEAVYRAWYTTDEPARNELLGYKLEKFHAKGAFGRVYKARNDQGTLFAIKVLLEEERRKKEFLQSFRRGVRSMRLLSTRGVDGIVGYIEAYEIPTFVVMEWIDGPNLDKAIRSKMIDNWPDILRVAKDVATIVENGHRIPERVLHRDLRPPNIMLQGLYRNRTDWKVVVLDFDLSWHLGASEKSVIGTGTTTGYLAPEQIQPNPKVSTRHSAVDSFGLGMTLFFTVARRDPYPAENLHKYWETNVSEYCGSVGSSIWRSLPTRFARLIINATREKQSERWDLNQIRVELERLREALQTPDEVESAELLAEEVFSRTSYSRNYKWNADKLCAILEFPSGAKISVLGHESKKQLRLGISWTYTGGSTPKQLFKKLEKSFDQIKRQVASVDWICEDRSKSGKSINFTAHLDVQVAKTKIDIVARNLDNIVTALSRLSSP
jgi:serine/threonine protein kinase